MLVYPEMVVVYYCKDGKVAKTVYDKIKAEYDAADAEEKKEDVKKEESKKEEVKKEETKRARGIVSSKNTF